MVFHSPPRCRGDKFNGVTVDRRDRLILTYEPSGAVPCKITPMVDSLAIWRTTFQPELKLKLRHFEGHTCHSLTSLHGRLLEYYTETNPNIVWEIYKIHDLNYID